jgi:hypothetical protein
LKEAICEDFIPNQGAKVFLNLTYCGIINYAVLKLTSLREIGASVIYDPISICYILFFSKWKLSKSSSIQMIKIMLANIAVFLYDGG